MNPERAAALVQAMVEGAPVEDLASTTDVAVGSDKDR
jgi:(2Fe-2S) ferredoxin